MSRSFKLGLELAALFLGGVFFLYVLRYFGFEATFRALSHVGWASWPAFFFYPFMSLWDVAAWKFAFGRQTAPQLRWKELFWIRLAGEALNNVTPFIDIGGEPLKIHLLVRRLGVSASSATSATVVARTSLLLSEAFFMLSGVVLSFWLIPMQARYRWQLTALLCAVCAAFFVFLWAQQKGWLKKLSPEISGYYSGESRRFWKAVPLNSLGWVSGGVETYLFCRLLGTELSLLQSVMLEALLQLIRTGSFFIPGNLGAQEGGLALFVGQMGLDPVFGVGISLLKRFRQVVWTAAGFLVWRVYQYREAKKKPRSIDN